MTGWEQKQHKQGGGKRVVSTHRSQMPPRPPLAWAHQTQEPLTSRGRHQLPAWTYRPPGGPHPTRSLLCLRQRLEGAP